MARANPQWRHFREDREVLAIVQGPHAYITPSWYAPGPNVPTWNYAVVHAYGTPRIIDDDDALIEQLARLVERHEAGFERPWRLDREDPWTRGLLRAIVGFELRLTRLEGKFKLNQNRTEADRAGVIRGLRESGYPGDRELAALMAERCPTRPVNGGEPRD